MNKMIESNTIASVSSIPEKNSQRIMIRDRGLFKRDSKSWNVARGNAVDKRLPSALLFYSIRPAGNHRRIDESMSSSDRISRPGMLGAILAGSAGFMVGCMATRATTNPTISRTTMSTPTALLL